MAILNRTPLELLVDPQGRPYFLWDMEMTLEEFQRVLKDSDPEVRAYFAGKLMRQAKPDDVFSYLSLADMSDLWPRIRSHLGDTRPFWTWLLGKWSVIPSGEE